MTLNRDRLAALAAKTRHPKRHFRNLEPIPARGLREVLRWQLAPGRRFPRGKRYDVLQPEGDALRHPPAVPQLTWLGHASFLFQYQGVNLLTDPVLSERASPLPFVGPRRYTAAALEVAELPAIHRVLISHNHYDHLDETTIRKLYKRFGNALCFCIPQGLRPWFEKRGI
ncbi:MAG: MBL fold metallo-hydrolase, partial [Oleiphilaceae bacterium]|nr:MBL fold metallo-hydrolase [Oleiphilaceae bacterium]